MQIKEFESKVLKVWQETPEIKAFHFSIPTDFSFQPAQHVIIELSLDGKKEMKAFSIASSPSKKYIEIAKRISKSEFSKKLNSLKEGDVIKIKGPYGSFFLDQSKNAVMIAGGIGIAPFKCMIEYATEKGLAIKINLLFSNKTPEDIPFKEKLDELQRKNPNFKIVYTITRPEKSKKEWKGLTGRINEDMIKKILNENKAREKMFYVCGPPEMVNSIIKLLQKMQIPSEQIRAERFTGCKEEE